MSDAIGLAQLEEHYSNPRCAEDLKRLQLEYDVIQAQKVHAFHEQERWLRARRWDAEVRGDHHQPPPPSADVAGPNPLGAADDDDGKKKIEPAQLPHHVMSDRRHSDDEFRMQQLHANKVADHLQAMQDGRRRMQLHADLRHGQMKRSDFLMKQQQQQQSTSRILSSSSDASSSSSFVSWSGKNAEQDVNARRAPRFFDFVTWFDVTLVVLIVVYFAVKFGLVARFASSSPRRSL